MYRWPHHWTGLIALPLQPLAPLAARAEDAAPRSPTEALQAIAAALPQDLSVWGMVVNADWMVRSVLTFLLAASVLTWTIALAKGLELRAERRRVQAGVAALNAAGSLDEAARRLMPLRGPCAILVRAAQEEVRMSVSGPGERLGRDGIKERAAWHLERLAATAVRSLGRGVGILATIGATAPFIGLFGTVWGIMNSFIGISRAQTTNLAVVAPGIAEALLATATGLFAAIPAVVIYNLFARATADRRADLLDAVAETMRLLSRDLDRGASGRLRAVGE